MSFIHALFRYIYTTGPCRLENMVLAVKILCSCNVMHDGVMNAVYKGSMNKHGMVRHSVTLRHFLDNGLKKRNFSIDNYRLQPTVGLSKQGLWKRFGASRQINGHFQIKIPNL